MMRRPRSFADEHFRDSSGDWPVDMDADPAEVAGAWLQYRIAKSIWQALAAGELTIGGIGAAFGQSSENQRRKLAGDSPAYASDIAGWLMLCGAPGFEGLPDSDEDLFPPAYSAALGHWQAGRREFPAFESASSLENIAILSEAIHNSLVEHVDAELADHVTSDVVLLHIALTLRAFGIARSRLHRTATGSGETRLAVRKPSSGHAAFWGLAFVRETVSTGDAALDAMWQIRTAVSEAAESGGVPSVVMIFCDDDGFEIVTDAIGAHLPDSRVPLLVGPFETTSQRARHSWWSSNSVELFCERQGVSGGIQLIALATLKAHQP